MESAVPSDVQVDALYQFGGEACWFYRGSQMRTRQPMVALPNGESQCSNRFIYEREVAPIPPHRMLLRRCTTIACCNPQHYEVSQAQYDGVYKKRTLQFHKDHLTPEVEAEFADPEHDVQGYIPLVITPLATLLGMKADEVLAARWDRAWYEALVLLAASRATIAESMYLMQCTKTEVSNGLRRARRTPEIMRQTRLDSITLFGVDICGAPKTPFNLALKAFLRGRAPDMERYVRGNMLLERVPAGDDAARARGLVALTYDKKAREELLNLLIDYDKEVERARFLMHMRKIEGR